MSKTWKWFRIAGFVLHCLLGAMMILASSGKVLALSNVVEHMKTMGLENQVQLIGAGELITAILLVIPRTSSLGVLLASAFWGGAICLHMAHDQSYVLVSVLLALTWVGAGLRQPMMFSSFMASCQHKAKVANTPEPLAA
jgi:hypothetical protein